MVIVEAELLEIFRNFWQDGIRLLPNEQQLKRGMLLLLLNPLYQSSFNRVKLVVQKNLLPRLRAHILVHAGYLLHGQNCEVQKALAADILVVFVKVE